MLTMRLQRYGRKNNPSFRVVVTDSRNSPKTGNHVDVLGSYNPKGGEFKIDGEKAKHWISKGVQTSDTVHNFLVSQNIIEGKKINVLPRKTPIIDEAKVKAEAEAKAAADKVNAEGGEGDLGQAAAQLAEAAPEAPAEAPAEEVPAPEAPVEDTHTEVPATEAPAESTSEIK